MEIPQVRTIIVLRKYSSLDFLKSKIVFLEMRKNEFS